MTRQTTSVEVSSFVRGLITEASPLTFPENASLAEENFVLNRDGSRERRLGMDLESLYEHVDAGVENIPEGGIAFSSFLWKNVGGLAGRNFIVIQSGQRLTFFNADSSPLSSGVIHVEDLASTREEQVFAYASVDGRLIVATGEKPVHVFSYEEDVISHETKRIRIRDQFGVEDIDSGIDLTEGQGVTRRPTSLSNAHRYNLRNQSWAAMRDPGESSGYQLEDPIATFKQQGSTFPSNADTVGQALYPNANDSDNRTGDQFYAKDLIRNPVGSTRAAQGFFIIDALDRGTSRQEEVDKLYSGTGLSYPINNLPQDSTPSGATAVEQYAGRVWYGGFSGEVIGGDEKSPRLGSYIFFSQLVQDPSNITSCYQKGDPSSPKEPDLIDTDGGFIRIDGAFNVQKFVNVGAGLLVLAENGVWMVTGGSDYGFSATNYMRRKVSDRGVNSPGSVVVIDNSLIFWAEDAIYSVAPNQFGDYGAENLTQTTIQEFYDGIGPQDKRFAQGVYDSYERKVRWVYQNRKPESTGSKELVFDLDLGAFYPHTIYSSPASPYPRIASPVNTPPYRLSEFQEPITYGGEVVTYEGENVTTEVSLRGQAAREAVYLTITGENPVTYSFSTYSDEQFRDWRSVDGVGVDAKAFLITGYLSGGDFLRYKQVPYVQFYFEKTEDGFIEDETGNLFATGESSCLVQAQWDWANSPVSNRWGRTFQAYRHKRRYMPSGEDDEFDNGFEVVVTKNKLRGKGKVISLKMTTEPDKNCKILGWSMLVGVTGNV